MSKRPSKTWYSKMKPEELDALATQVGREVEYAQTRPLTPAMRKQEQRARRKRPGRPRVGLGAQKLRISMERGLLKQVDSYAKARGMTRSDLIAQSLRRLLAG